MLQYTFSHIPGIGLNTERKIWTSGISSVDEFLETPPGFFSPAKINKIIDFILISKEKIAEHDANYFYNCLLTKEHWRLFREFQKFTAYIDIETTGLGFPGDIITTIALFDGENIKYYINGINLNEFIQDIRSYRLIVSYNGKTFDIPFIEKYFGIHIPQAHIDLRYLLCSLGYRGGLKSCERQAGIGRTGDLREVDGFFAVLLWNDYKKTRNAKSLETLLSYNIEDVLSLQYLMIWAYNQKLQTLPVFAEPLAIPQHPENPFNINRETVERIKNLYYYSL